MSEIELKPCPFCGGVNIRVGFILDRTRVWCGKCGGSMINFDPDCAKQLWNKRPSQYNKARYAKRKNDGLCVYCGAKNENTDSVLCSECKSKSIEASRYNRKKKKLIEENGDERRQDF